MAEIWTAVGVEKILWRMENKKTEKPVEQLQRSLLLHNDGTPGGVGQYTLTL